ncbi:MAG TPA: SDR family NAD(P)-dependent oxidoreductase [Acidimicrobiales bacterium]|jgi:NAD(P)-dependent dehydrogenase (short-subunit alcohol dehydrogenase family)|nr:SDR family NAD(P)-dependent oxidoreductase [Acidimicrobiales bacterium]
MGALDGRICIITGAGRGIGREHARLFAAEGAQVVVNDNGSAADGTGHDPAVAEAVVKELVDAGGVAVGSSADVSTMAGAQSVLDLALEAFGDVHVVVNNAGVLRDKMFANMSEEDWDAVIAGHLKTTFCMSRVACGRWRDENKAGKAVNAAIVNTSSTSGLIGSVGQTNYGAAKAAIASFTMILAMEAQRYGVRVNAISPAARTRMTEDSPGTKDLVKKPDDPSEFDVFHPRHVPPVVAYLASADCPLTGRVFMVKGGDIRPFVPWQRMPWIARPEHFTVADVAELMKSVPDVPVSP